MLVAAAAAPLSGGRHGGRLLQLRVSALGAPRKLRESREPLNRTSRERNAKLDAPIVESRRAQKLSGCESDSRSRVIRPAG